ncbi:MAG: NADH-quinone oxidoreductase subunit NuoH [SAR202 cluster bacterium]|nr:NADH-quinone oxidoreductase subunit NuoH [SAR202 cluster bacterium]
MSFRNLYDIADRFLPESLDWMAYLVAGGILAFVVINAMVMSTAAYTLFERRLIGRFQSRLGPNRWGPFGMFQPFADIIKLILKEDIAPTVADKIVFTISPVVFLVPVLVAVSVLPLGDGSFLGTLNVALVFIIAVTGMHIIGVFMAGWASRNKYALFGAMRGVAMLVSYEVPMAMSLVAVVLLSGTMSTLGIVQGQHLPYILVMPLGFFVFFTATLAEMSRAPFDMIEAESELGSGYNTEYSGMKFALFQLAEFMAPLANGAIVTVLFLGGTKGPIISGPWWFVLKVVAFAFVIVWTRSTWPRLRVDQIMTFSWKGLFPLSMINLALVTVEYFVLQDAVGALTLGDQAIMALINIPVTFVAIYVIGNLSGQKRDRTVPVPSPLARMAAEAD